MPVSAHPRRLLCLPLLIGLLGGCSSYGFWSYPPQARGNQIDNDELSQLIPGTSTRQDVTALLGSPTIKAPFDDSIWIYVSQVTRPVIGGTQYVRTQHVYEVSFDDKGVLNKIATKDKKDALPVQVVSRTTPSPGSKASILQQLLGNIGRFNPAGAQQQTGPASTNSPGNY